MDTSEYYGGLYPSPPEKAEEKIYDEDFQNEDEYYDERRMEELENGK